ncbi:MAG: hypothetical protein L6V93_21285 [Clostridiales bacterium]|nr:MAG: hypothetical protein L6V93_21285 [Clostridiales bacterium]
MMFNDGGKSGCQFQKQGRGGVPRHFFGNDVLIAGKRYMRVADNKEKWYLKTGKDIASAQFFSATTKPRSFIRARWFSLNIFE